MKKPLVSIIITTKNEAKNIGRLLESIKTQTYKNIEIIVVDNNSEDNTRRVAKRYTKKVYNKGPERSVQRNFGAKKSSGRYLIILDADMRLSSKVVEDCVETARNSEFKALVIPEKTVGNHWLAKVRQFEREKYMGDLTIEVARFFDKKIFDELGGYDVNLTGAEDYDLPKRINQKYKIGRSSVYLFHHEEDMTLAKLLAKRFYYASKSAAYADKHPDLVKVQGTIIIRRAYLRHWKEFIKRPLLGIVFLFVRSLETVAAVSGYISSVGFAKFLKTFIRMFRT